MIIHDNIANLFFSLLFILSLPLFERCFDIISFCEIICVGVQLLLQRKKPSKDQSQNMTKVKTRIFRGRKSIEWCTLPLCANIIVGTELVWHQKRLWKDKLKCSAAVCQCNLCHILCSPVSKFRGSPQGQAWRQSKTKYVKIILLLQTTPRDHVTKKMSNIKNQHVGNFNVL